MKNFKIFSTFLVLISALVLTSCDDNPVDPHVFDDADGAPGAASFSVDYGDQKFESTTANAVISNGITTITGIKGTKGEIFTIVVQGDSIRKDSIGNFLPYTSEEVSISYVIPGTSGKEYTNFNPDTDATQQVSGAVVFEKIDATAGTVAGRFSLTGWNTDNASDSIVFFNGKFEIGASLDEDIPTDPGTDPGTTPEGEYFKAKVGATNYDFDTPTIISLSGMLSLSGTDTASTTTIMLTMPETVTAGTYNLNGSVAMTTAMYSSGTNAYMATAGSLVITANTGTVITGTFTFTGTNPVDNSTIQVTNGQFSQSY